MKADENILPLREAVAKLRAERASETLSLAQKYRELGQKAKADRLETKGTARFRSWTRCFALAGMSSNSMTPRSITRFDSAKRAGSGFGGAGLAAQGGSARVLIGDQFAEAFEAINANFQESFRTLFGGGTGMMRLTEESEPGEAGVELIVQPE